MREILVYVSDFYAGDLQEDILVRAVETAIILKNPDTKLIVLTNKCFELQNENIIFNRRSDDVFYFIGTIENVAADLGEESIRWT